jgi:hypothetical protein
MMPARNSGPVKSQPAFSLPGMYELEHTVQCTYNKSRKLLQPRRNQWKKNSHLSCQHKLRTVLKPSQRCSWVTHSPVYAAVDVSKEHTAFIFQVSSDQDVFLGLLTLEDNGCTFPGNVRNHLPSGPASDARRMESSYITSVFSHSDT